MIRFIFIGDQISDHSSDFAFYDTIIDAFITIDGEQVWGNLDAFEGAFKQSGKTNKQRFLDLIPRKEFCPECSFIRGHHGTCIHWGEL